MALHESVDIPLLSLAKVRMLFSKKGNLLVGVGETFIACFVAEGMRFIGHLNEDIS
jgi:hypothetical protein